MEELYGKYYGLKHSPIVKKEMRKDSIFFCGIIALSLFIVFEYKNRDYYEHESWLKYYYSELPNKRDNLVRKE